MCGHSLGPMTSPATSSIPLDHGQRWRDVDRIEGVGGGVFLVTPVFQFQLSVARGLGLGTRVHASTGVGF